MADAKEQQQRGLKLKNDSTDKPTSSEFQQNLAVVIGIDRYSNGIPSLSTAVNDACALAKILKNKHGYKVTLLTDEKATLARLKKEFTKKLPGKISENDRLLVYFAGHGVATDGDDGPAGFLIPQDAKREDSSTFWAMTELHEALENLPCRHMLAIFDCCFAGAFRWSSKRDFQPLPQVIYKERYDRFICDAAWQVITSASYDQKALDILSGNVRGEQGIEQQQEQQHSPFALALFEALHGAADTAPKDGDGVITATELYIYLRDEVEVPAQKLAAHHQTPGLWPLNRHEHGEFIFLVPGHKLYLPSAPDLTKENNPYKGLSPYEKGDSELFFGRTELIKKLKKKVDEQPFTVVLGASGTGKSSLVKAGLLPVLEKEEKKATKENGENQVSPWFIPQEIMRPGADPLPTLHSLLIRELPGVSAVRAKEISLTGLIEKWAEKNSGQKLLLVIDQFEELITLCRQEEKRGAFIRELKQALEDHSGILSILLTLRSDFESQISQLDFWEGDWERAHRFIVRPMTQNELREVIEQPASVKVLYFEPRTLIDTLINEVLQTPGALPLLSFTLYELYLGYAKNPDGSRALTETKYKKIGGVIGSLRRRINEEYEKLKDSPGYQETMRRILLRMVAFEGGELTRRQVSIWEFDYPDAAENDRVEEILETLFEARLIVGNDTEDGDDKAEPYVEAAHDELIVAWEKLFEWRDKEGEKMLLHRQLTQVAADWKRGENEKERKALLWDNSPRLGRVQEFLEQESFGDTEGGTKVERKQRSFRLLRQFCKNLFPSFAPLEQHVWLNRVETDFVRRSIERKRNWTREVTYFIILVVVSLSAIAFIAWQQRDLALQQKKTAEDARIEADDQREKAVEKEREARHQLAMNHWSNGFNERDRNQDGSLMALHFWSKAAQQFAALAMKNKYDNALLAHKFIQKGTSLVGILEREYLYNKYSTFGASFNKNGEKILTWTKNSARVWDGERVLPVTSILKDNNSTIKGAVFTNDGSKLLVWSNSGARVWNTATGTSLTSIMKHQGELGDASFSHNEKLIITWNNKDTSFFTEDQEYRTVKIWDSRTGSLSTSPLKHKRKINGAIFNGDGSQVLTWSIDGTVRVWSSSTGTELFPALNHSGPVKKALYSNDERLLLTLVNDPPALGGIKGGDYIAYVWDSITGNLHATMKHISPINGAIFNRNGSQLMTWSYDGTVRVWDTSNGKELFLALKHEKNVSGAVYNKNETQILTWSDDGTARLWDSISGHPLTSPMKHNLPVGGATFNGDESRILTWSEDGTARIWNSRLGSKLFPAMKHEGKILGAVFNKNESRVLTWSDDGTARLWDSTTGRALTSPMKHNLALRGAVFNQKESRILTWSDDGTARLWDNPPDDLLLVNIKSKNSIAGALFNNDESKILTLGAGTQIWDSGTGKPLSALIENDIPINDQTRFNSDKSKIITIKNAFDSSAGEVQIWDSSSGIPLTSLPMQHDRSVSGVRFTKNEQKIITWSYNKVRIWDSRTGTPLVTPMEHKRTVLDATFNRNENWILTRSGNLSDGAVRIWDSNTGQSLMLPMVHKAGVDGVKRNEHQIMKGAEFNRNEDRILVWGDYDVRIWNINTNPASSLIFPIKLVNGAKFSADENKVLTWGKKGACIWSSITGTSLTDRMIPGEGAIFSRDETKILTWGKIDTGKFGARVWDSKTGKPLIPVLEHDNGVTARFSEDERWILTWSFDHKARVWDAITGKPLSPFLEHESSVNQALFTKNKSRVLTLSGKNDKGAAQIWDSATGKPLTFPLQHKGNVWNAMFNNDETRILTWSFKGSVHVWDISIDRQWPTDKLVLKTEVETGTILDATGELKVLGAAKWQKNKWCEYDKIQYQLKRIKDTEWQASQRLCEQLNSSEAK